MDDLLAIADKKSYLPEVAYEALAGLFGSIPLGLLRSALLPKLKSRLERPVAEWTPELLSLVFSIVTTYRLEANELSSSLSKAELLDPAHLSKFKAPLLVLSHPLSFLPNITS